MIVLLAAAATISFGTCGPGATTWTVRYADGTTESYATPDNRLDLLPRPGLRFTLIQCQDAGCSSPQEFVVNPVPADADYDGCLGIDDWLALSARWGDCVQ